MPRLLLLALLLAPRLDAPIDGYADYDGLTKRLQALAAPAKLSSLGKTIGGREIHLVTIGTGKADEKPAILVVGTVHAPHLLGSELALRVAERLAKADAASFDRLTLYVIPRPSPDGAERFFRKPFVERPGNDRKSNDDRDLESGEDGPDDLDGDGWITMMRIEDETGSMTTHPDDPRVLVPADAKKNEPAKYALHVEGRDDDGDGKFNEDGGDGVSFNRNFTFNYPVFKPGAGPHAVSEVETRAVADFVFDHPNIAAVITFTPEDNLATPWKADPASEGNRIKTRLLGADQPFTDYVAEQYRKIHGATDPPGPPGGEGSFSEWAYFHTGRWSFAARGWWIPKVPAEPASKDPRAADALNALRWFKKEGIDGFADWKKIDHPGFPGRTVEVGGFRPFLTLNPPSKELDALGDKHADFVKKLAELMPRLKIGDVKVEDLGEGLFRVTVPVVNTGYLPTMSEMGRLSNQAWPLQLKIELPEKASIVTGAARVKLGVIAGGGGKTEHAWLVRGTGEIKLSAWAPAVGIDTKSVVLK
jgi:hypothetical protein